MVFIPVIPNPFSVKSLKVSIIGRNKIYIKYIVFNYCYYSYCFQNIQITIQVYYSVLYLYFKITFMFITSE